MPNTSTDTHGIIMWSVKPERAKSFNIRKRKKVRPKVPMILTRKGVKTTKRGACEGAPHFALKVFVPFLPYFQPYGNIVVQSSGKPGIH